MTGVELITGHKATNHITSDDGRAANRAIFGKGAYKLYGEYNSSPTGNACGITVQSYSGGKYSIRFGVGLLYWNGMFIRITQTISQSLVTSEEGMKVYLHYTRDAQTAVEEVEIIFSTTEYTSTPDFDFDNTTEAYLLVCSFANTDGTGKTEYLPIFEDIVGKKKKMNTFSTSQNPQMYELTASYTNLTNAASGSEADATTDVALKDKPTNFEFIEIRVAEGSGSGNFRQIFRFPSHYFKYASSGAGKRDISWTVRYGAGAKTYYFQFYYNSDEDIVSFGKLYVYDGATFAGTGSTYCVRIYGVGRVAND